MQAFNCENFLEDQLELNDEVKAKLDQSRSETRRQLTRRASPSEPWPPRSKSEPLLWVPWW